MPGRIILGSPDLARRRANESLGRKPGFLRLRRRKRFPEFVQEGVPKPLGAWSDPSVKQRFTGYSVLIPLTIVFLFVSYAALTIKPTSFL